MNGYALSAATIDATIVESDKDVLMLDGSDDDNNGNASSK